MIKLIGNKNILAVEFEIFEFKHGLNSNVLIWLNNTPLGNFNETGYLSSVLLSLNGIVNNSEELWFGELNNLKCKDIFYTITPLYNNPDSFFELSEKEQDSLVKYDKFLFEWGDGFNDWNLRVVVNAGICKFLWVHTPLGVEDSFEVRNNIKCFDVDLINVKSVYDQMKKNIPNEFWPSLIR